MSQDDLAQAVKVDERTVRNWESGATSPKSRLGALERMLNVNLREDQSLRRTTLEEASDAQLIAALAGRLAERNDQVRSLITTLDELRGDLAIPAKWAARARDPQDSPPGRTEPT